MKTSENGLRLIKNFEGCRLTAYVCSAGVLTIGYGHTGGVTRGMTITQKQADEYLKKDVERFEKAVNNYVTKLKLNQNQFDALVSFTFNCGEKNLQSLCRNRNTTQIADALLLYNKGGGKVLQGLVNRRKAERELFIKDMKNEIKEHKKLPYEVITTCDLNIRKGPGTNYGIKRVAKKGEKLKVWAVTTNNDMEWGKNGDEYYCLRYCMII